MITFEENFPSLEDKEDHMEGDWEYSEEVPMGFHQSDVEEHCLDKQRVREIIDKLIELHSEGSIISAGTAIAGKAALRTLKQKLGLDQ